MKVENDENWVRDTESGALVRIDKDVDYNKVQRKRKELIDKKIGNDISSFWLNDTLTISPDEQLGLIKRLYFKQHPFRASVQEQVKKMMLVVNNAQYQLAYQQGKIVRGNKQQAWLVGWIEENRHVYPFVLSFDAALDADTDAIGKKLSEDILRDLGFFKGIM